jgi:hypothetical protein
MTDKTPSAGAKRAAKTIHGNYYYSAWETLHEKDLRDIAETIDQESGASDMASQLELALEWIENIIDRVGMDAIENTLPNYFGGRVSMKAAVKKYRG